MKKIVMTEMEFQAKCREFNQLDLSQKIKQMKLNLILIEKCFISGVDIDIWVSKESIPLPAQIEFLELHLKNMKFHKNS